MSLRRYAAILFLVIVVMLAVLRFDGPSFERQALLGATAVLLLAAVTWAGGISHRAIVTVVVIATTGEVVLSLWWGLYDYPHALIPTYVPPGHGVFYAVAVAATRVTELKRYERLIAGTVLFSLSAYAVASHLVYGDSWGLLWWCGAALFLVRSKEPILLSVCFLATFILELVGTAWGNWVWFSEVPGIPFESANPPAGVGILYGILDLMTNGSVSWWLSRTKASDAEGEPVAQEELGDEPMEPAG